jgi:hypothetical protein
VITHLLAAHHLGRHVCEGAGAGVLGERVAGVLLQPARQPEVAHQHPPVHVHQQVVRLEVAVHHLGGVDRSHALRRVEQRAQQQRQHGGGWQRRRRELARAGGLQQQQHAVAGADATAERVLRVVEAVVERALRGVLHHDRDVGRLDAPVRRRRRRRRLSAG